MLNSVFLCPTIGLNEIDASGQIKVFPNSFDNNLYFTSENDRLYEITLYDVVSRKVVHLSFVKSISINTVALTSGVYMYAIHNKNDVIKKGKLVKR